MDSPKITIISFEEYQKGKELLSSNDFQIMEFLKTFRTEEDTNNNIIIQQNEPTNLHVPTISSVLS